VRPQYEAPGARTTLPPLTPQTPPKPLGPLKPRQPAHLRCGWFWGGWSWHLPRLARKSRHMLRPRSEKGFSDADRPG
jgi:hypothetical protein